MAGSYTDFFEHEVLKVATGQTTTLTLPITPYLALGTASPTEVAPGTAFEVASGVGYARQSSAGSWGAPSGGAVSNNAVVNFGTSSAAWGTVTHVMAFTTSPIAGGTCIWYADLTTPLVVGGANISVQFDTSTNKITLTQT